MHTTVTTHATYNVNSLRYKNADVAGYDNLLPMY